MENSIALVDDPLFDLHMAQGPHPERPERLAAAREAVTASTQRLGARDATDEELARVHSDQHATLLRRAERETGYFDTDTYFCDESVAAARRAAGGMAALVEALVNGPTRYGVGLVRPPGHHATGDRPMGFCLINNVAVAAAHARSLGVERVAIVDWDVHHGNGTQDIFYGDPSVLYVSLHQSPFYPGTGDAEEVGSGEGEGFTVNIPLSAGADDGVYAAAFQRIVSPIVSQFSPQLLLVSAGFDAHSSDPLANMAMSADGYATMTTSLIEATGGPSCPVGFVLEGGYDLHALSTSLTATLSALDRPRGDLGHPPPSERHAAEVALSAAVLGRYWKLG